MPKVTEEYKQQKRNKILNAALEVLEKKPLYEMSMLDVIKQANLSKGGIYLYFSDLDELLVEMINTIFSGQEEPDFSFCENPSDVEQGLISMFRHLADYIEGCSHIAGKIRYELNIYLTNNPGKINDFLPRLEIKQTATEFMTQTASLIQNGIKQKLFRSDLDLDLIMTNISVYIDGMSDQVVKMKAYNGPELVHPVRDYFTEYIKSQILHWKV